jgi:UDP-2,4-diacetamido-2,4,6-trideoxy-beta-L-altropyranose hydrolase
MHCAFIVRASAQSGMGHLMRCLALAQALVSEKHNATFMLDKQTYVMAMSREDWCGEVFDMDFCATLQIQIEAFKQQLGTTAVDWVIIDGYNFTQRYCRAWKDAGFRVALFDDGVHPPPHVVDLLINPSADKNMSEKIPILAGQDYRLLRREFADVKTLPVDQRRFLTLAFGGSDPANITIPLLITLNNLKIDASIRVVTGEAYPFLDELEATMQACSLNIEHVHAVQNMADVWLSSRLVVSAAGGSQFELAVCATPSILAVVADNQLRATEKAVSEGWCEVADLSGELNRASGVLALGQAIEQIWNDEHRLIAMQKSIIGKYDALGAKRIVGALSAYV